MGRPPVYGQDTRDEICKRISQGESLISICKCEGMPDKTTVMDWLFKEPDFANQYARAREAQAEHYLDEIIAISDDSVLDTEMGEDGVERTNHEVVARARLRVDTRKWAMSKLAPKKYGDKVQNEHTGPNGGPIKVVSARDMTDDELAAIATTGGK